MTSNIEWCDATINPVTGCLHNCEYCYAKRMTKTYAKPWHVSPDFIPEFHEDRLRQITKAKGIVFVGSMCDLFGNWVPLVWIRDTIVSVKFNNGKATFIFLTKNPARYEQLLEDQPSLVERKNIWLGTTLDAGYNSTAPPVGDRAVAIDQLPYPRKWVSIEPFDVTQRAYYVNLAKFIGVQWAVIGFKTPVNEKAIDSALNAVWAVAEEFDERGISVFVKNSVIQASHDRWGDDTGDVEYPRDFPEGVKLATKGSEWKHKEPKVKKG